MGSPQTAAVNEHYHYASEGRRAMKTHLIPRGTVTSRQQVRYLSGLEIRLTRAGERETARLLVSDVGTVRINREAAGRRTLSGPHVCYSLSDRGGSATMELDNEGKLINSERYYPFGGTAAWATGKQAEATYKTKRYSGKERDMTGLLYYGYRYYAPWLMRWLNTDPAGTADGLNLFRMVRNNPSTWQDEDGRMPVAGDPFTLAAAFLSYALAIFPAHQAYCWLRDRPLKQYARQLSRATSTIGKDPGDYFDAYAAQAVAAGEDLDTQYLIEFELPDSKQLIETTFRETLNIGLLCYQMISKNQAKLYRANDMQVQFLRDHMVYEEKKISKKRQCPAESPGSNVCPATPSASTFIPPLMTTPATTPPRHRRSKRHQTATEPEGTRPSAPDATSSPDVTREAGFIRQYQRMNDVQQSITENAISALQERDVRATHSHRVQGFDKLYLADLRNFDGARKGRGDWRLLYSQQGGTLNLINVVSPHHGHHFKKW